MVAAVDGNSHIQKRGHPPPMSHAPHRRVASKKERAFWYLLLCGIGLLSMITPLFNRVSPAYFGVPFFLWFQFFCISAGSVATFAAYKRGA